MSEHDPDIDFDFFEDDPATEETSRTQRIIRRPGSGTRKTAART